MNNKDRFGLFETVCFITLVLITKTFYTAPKVLVRLTGTSGWYTTLVSCIVSICFFLLLYLLMKRFPGKDLISVLEESLGSYAGKFAALIFCGYFLYYAGSNLREFLEMIKAYNLPYTPPSIILGAFIAIILLLSYLGLETIARLSYVSFFPVIAGLIIILVLAHPYYNTDNIFPALGYGIDRTLTIGVLRSSAYSEIIILAIIINSVHGLKNFKKAGIVSLIITGTVFSASVLLYIMAFGYNAGGENLSGIFQLSRIIYFNRFFQRIESVFLFIWTISSLVTVAAAFYISVRTYAKVFRIKNHRPLLLPLAFLLFMVAILPVNLSETIEKNIQHIRQYSVSVIYGIPILALIISLIRRKKGEGKELEQS